MWGNKKPDPEKLASALRYAITYGPLHEVQKQAGKGADLNRIDEYGHTPLMHAVSQRRDKMIALLVNLGANVNATDSEGMTALMHAARSYEEASAKALLCAGADINLCNKAGETALHIAARHGWTSVVKVLVEHGADVTLCDKANNTPLSLAEARNESIAVIRNALPRVEKPVAPLPEPGWRLSAPDEVTCVTVKPEAGYAVTEMFNFHARLYVHISRNMATGNESESVRLFDELGDSPRLADARREFLRLGGFAPAKEPLKLPKPQGGTP